MTKQELEKWIKDNPKDGWDKTVIDGSYEFIEVDGKWKLIVDGNVNVGSMGLVELPNVFHSVSGFFVCSMNQLTSLEYCPSSVEELYCFSNQITSLEHCPSSVEGLYCWSNQLTSLEYCPSSVEALDCRDNQLTSLEHTPLNLKELNSDFSDEEYELYIQSEKDKLERDASTERVDEIEDLMELGR